MIDLPRISAFVLKESEKRLINLYQVPNYDKIINYPLGLHIDQEMKVTFLYNETKSLYQFLHHDLQDLNLDEKERLELKYHIAFKLS